MSAFAVTRWRAWAPGLATPEDWQRWAAGTGMPTEDGSVPDCAFLPAMQRRRLSRLARMATTVAWPLCDEDEQMPFVFGSRHGETTRTYAMLSDVIARQPLSPTRFGLSVHNAIAGQWSILRGQRGESVAVAGEADTFEHSVLEGLLQLAAGAPSVLVMVAEETPPAVYDGWIADVPCAYALALRLEPVTTRATDASRWTLQTGSPDSATGEGDPHPHALAWLRASLTAVDRLQHASEDGLRRWTWQRQS